MIEYDGMEWEMFGPSFQLSCCHELVSVLPFAASEVAVILDPSAVEPSESLGLGRRYGYGKISVETSDEFA